MSAIRVPRAEAEFPQLPSLQEDEVVELAVLLPGWQAQALETAAHDQGITTAQMVRTLIRDFFSQQLAGTDETVASWE